MLKHGDTAGEHNIFGKQTFYEGSARIPLIFTGTDIKSGKRINSAVSIMDIGQTLCELTAAVVPPQPDGCSLIDEIFTDKIDEARYVISEFVEKYNDDIVPGRMIRKGKWKLISYAGYKEHDLLFNLEDDPHELNNVVTEYYDKAKELRELIYKNWNIESIIENFEYKQENQQILNKWGEATNYQEQERWIIPAEITEINESNFV